jgi:hypothetical protein
MHKIFKVAALSSNRNSFGLRGMILIAKDGEAWQVGANHLYCRSVGELVCVPVVGDKGLSFAGLGFEIPEQLPDAPGAAVAEIWN